MIKQQIHFPSPKWISLCGEVPLLDSERFYNTQVGYQTQKSLLRLQVHVLICSDKLIFPNNIIFPNKIDIFSVSTGLQRFFAWVSTCHSLYWGHSFIFNEINEKPMSWKKILKYYKICSYVFSCLYVQISLHEDGKVTAFIIPFSYFSCSACHFLFAIVFFLFLILFQLLAFQSFLKELFQEHLPLWIILHTISS